jgi:hypothetical protein
MVISADLDASAFLPRYLSFHAGVSATLLLLRWML